MRKTRVGLRIALKPAVSRRCWLLCFFYILSSSFIKMQAQQVKETVSNVLHWILQHVGRH